MIKPHGIRCTSFAAVFVVLCLSAGKARSQEIRRVAEPSQQVRMAHGGYVCDGKLTVSALDDTYDMVSCSGPIYNAADYEAVYTKRNHDELAAMNANTQEALSRDLKAAIHRQFLLLPASLLQTAAIQNLEQSLINSVDERLPEGRGNIRLRRPASSTPANAPAGPPPSQE